MENHLQLSDQEFKHQFANCSLPANIFNHEAHLRLAYIHLRDHGEATAIQNVCEQIQTFDRTHGDGTVYHKTLTVAAVKAVYHFLQKAKSDSFVDFIQEFPRLKTNFKELMEAHYSFNLFASAEAKVSYVESDLLPFD